MPQATQILPEWSHPHEMVVINNNTWFLDVTADQEYYSARSVHVFMSPKGEDRKVLKLTHPNNFKEEFGVGDFKVHGQPYLNAYSFLERNESVLGYFLRVTAPDAKYSHIGIVAKVKVTDATANDPGKVEIHYEAVFIPDFTDASEAYYEFEAMKEDTTPDADGYLTYPIMLINARGRGVYGDQLRIRMIKDSIFDRENDYINYRLDVYELEQTLRNKNTVTGSIVEGAVQGNQTLFLESLNKSIKVGGKVNIQVNSEALMEIYDLYLAVVEPDVVTPLEQFDFFYGKVKGAENTAIDGFIVEDPANNPNALQFNNAEGIALMNGSDGIFAKPRKPSERIAREIAIEDAYLDAFSGKFDKTILSKRRTPQELFFDANYPEAVKYQIMSWLKTRGDGFGHIDAGIISTITEAVAWGEQFYPIGDRLYSKHCQSYEVLDPFTSSAVRVTYPYFLACNLPNHFENTGRHVPFAGENSYLTGHVENSVLPDVDADDQVSKDLLYQVRVNYLETLNENVYFRGTQTTSDVGATRKHFSDLNEENNMYMLLEYKRRIEDFSATLRYNFSEPEDRAIFTKRARAMFERDVGTRVRSIDVYFDATPFEEERSWLHCYLSVVFKSLVKTSIIEIDVNSRVSA